MARRKSIAILPHLIDCGGDMTKKWCVEYSMRDPETGEMKRFRNYGVFAKVQNKAKRYAVAAKLVTELSQKIASGWSPFGEDVKRYIYEDELTYSAVAVNYGKLKDSVGTVRVYLSEFLSIKKTEVNSKSFQTYQSKMRSFCAFLELKKLDLLDIRRIDNQAVIDFLTYQTDKKCLSRGSVSKYRQILFTFFEYVKIRQLIMENPVHGIPRLGEIKDCAPYPIPSNLRKKVGEEIKSKDRQLWLACCMMYFAAIRPGEEIRLLKVGDISFKSRKIIVRSTIAKSNRTDAVDMPSQLYEELMWQRVDICDPDLYVFGKYGRPGTEPTGKNTLRNRFNRIRDGLHLSKSFKFYSWKHSGAEALADWGASTWEIQAHLRHRDIETTERYARKRLGNRNSRIKNEFPDI
jgi:integrase